MKTIDAISYAGGIRGLCSLLGCKRSAVYQWGTEVPTSRQYELEVKSFGLLKSDYTLRREKDASDRGKK